MIPFSVIQILFFILGWRSILPVDQVQDPADKRRDWQGGDLGVQLAPAPGQGHGRPDPSPDRPRTLPEGVDCKSGHLPGGLWRVCHRILRQWTHATGSYSQRSFRQTTDVPGTLFTKYLKNILCVMLNLRIEGDSYMAFEKQYCSSMSLFELNIVFNITF